MALDTYHLEGERLVIMPTTFGRTHSAELLASDRAQTLLRSMRVSDEKNLFICDLPPVFANDDAATVMARLDAYIVVAEEGKTKQRESDGRRRPPRRGTTRRASSSTSIAAASSAKATASMTITPRATAQTEPNGKR